LELLPPRCDHNIRGGGKTKARQKRKDVMAFQRNEQQKLMTDCSKETRGEDALEEKSVKGQTFPPN
jgi:hypothetical protein